MDQMRKVRPVNWTGRNVWGYYGTYSSSSYGSSSAATQGYRAGSYYFQNTIPTDTTSQANTTPNSLEDIYKNQLGTPYGEGNYCDEFVVQGLQGLGDQTTLNKMYGSTGGPGTSTMQDAYRNVQSGHGSELKSGAQMESRLGQGEKAVVFYDGNRDGKYEHMAIVERDSGTGQINVFHSGGSRNMSQMVTYTSLGSLENSWGGQFQYLETTR